MALIRDQRDMKLLVEVETNLRLVRYAPGRIEFQPTESAPASLAATLSQRLQAWTGARWGVSVVSEGGGATVAEERDATETAARADVMDDPLVQAVLASFPKAKITKITPYSADAPVADDAAGDDMTDGDWDPFEDD